MVAGGFIRRGARTPESAQNKQDQEDLLSMNGLELLGMVITAWAFCRAGRDAAAVWGKSVT